MPPYTTRWVPPTCSITCILREGDVISLNPYYQLAIVGSRCWDDIAVNILERRRAVLKQGYLVIQQGRGLIRVLRAEFHVEDAVGSIAGRGGKDATSGTRRGAASCGALVRPIRS